MFTDDNCKDWDVRVVGEGKCVEFCRVDEKALVEGNDCDSCRGEQEQTKLI